MAFVLALAASYLVGSIPFGLLLGKAKGVDVREHGSRNIGATNVWRVRGKALGLTAFALDFLKGLLPALLFWRLSPGWPAPPYGPILCGAAAVLGHTFPVWLKFKGGKGVATSAGFMAGVMWLPFVIALAVFVAVVAWSRYISLGSMLASVALVIAAILFTPYPLTINLPLTVLSVLLCFLIIIRHRNNIERIRNGTENRFPPPKNKA